MLPGMRIAWALVAILAVSSCGGPQPAVTSMQQPPPPPEGSAAPEPSKVAPAEPAPELRLDRSVVPREYAVDLTLDPGKDSFTGTITIPVDLARATRTIWLHGKTLTIRSATIDART